MAYNLTHTGAEVDATVSTVQNIIDLIHPIGDIYLTMDSTDPSTKFPGTTWERIKDKFLLAAGDTYAAASTGGSATHTHSVTAAGTVEDHTLTEAETPAHTHTRGTMNITGTLMYNKTYSGSNFSGDSFDGAFHSVAVNGQQYYLSGRSGGVGWHDIGFDASRNWTGETSSAGGGDSHNHGFTGSAVTSSSTSNIPPYLTVYMWRRTA